jgi:parvulin-like peptidyl-prolyl isomerase
VPRSKPIRRARALASASIAAVTLAGCGGGAPANLAAQVGTSTISKATVANWMVVLAPGHTVPRAGTNAYQALRQKALGFLISAHWLIGEAAERGVGVSEGELQQRFDAKKHNLFPNGQSELEEFQKSSGQTAADLMLETQVELDSQRLHELIGRETPPVTQAQVASYYQGNRQRFRIPERREILITNRKTIPEGIALKRESEAKHDFAGIAEVQLVEPNHYPNPKHNIDAIEAAPLEDAVFSAKPGVLTGPIRLRVDYQIFEVRRIIPARYPTLAQVQGTIEQQLSSEQQQRTLAEFVRTWRTKWIASTSCQPGFVISKCRQHGDIAATLREDPYSLD